MDRKQFSARCNYNSIGVGSVERAKKPKRECIHRPATGSVIVADNILYNPWKLQPRSPTLTIYTPGPVLAAHIALLQLFFAPVNDIRLSFHSAKDQVPMLHFHKFT